MQPTGRRRDPTVADPARSRLTAQGLATRGARTPVEVAQRLLAIQAQDPRGARLAIRARSTGLTAADVDRALTVDRSLIVTWANRGTLHLIRAEDHAWLHALTAPRQVTANARRLAEEGVPPADADRAVAAVVRALADSGPLSREALGDTIEAAGVRARGQALVHVLFAATLRGHVVRGPVLDGRQAFVLAEDWLGPQPPVDSDCALAELARRYLAGHAPADARDLARWAGITLAAARRGLAAIAPQLRERPDRLLELERPAEPPGEAPPPPRLLGPFDPVLHGWVDRSWVVGAHQQVVTVNGIFKATALVAGRVVATWRRPGPEVLLDVLEPVDAATRAALQQDARDMADFMQVAQPDDVTGRGSATVR